MENINITKIRQLTFEDRVKWLEGVINNDSYDHGLSLSIHLLFTKEEKEILINRKNRSKKLKELLGE